MSQISFNLISFLVLINLMSTSSCSFGQAPQNDLNLNQATNLAIANSPDIRQITWQIEKTTATGYQNSRLVNPQIGTVATEIGNEGQAGQYGFFLQRNIVRNNRVEEIQQSFQWQARSLEVQSRIKQREIAREIASVYIEIGFTMSRMELATQKKTELERIRKVVSRLAKGGETSELQVSKLDIELETAKQELELLRMELTSQLKRLASFTGNSLPIELDFDFRDEVQMVLNTDLARNVDLDSHPSVEFVSKQIEAQKWRLQLANSRTRPDWQLQTSVNYDFAADDFFGGFQLNVPWQLNDRKQGLIAAESSEIQILTEEKKRIKKLLERQLIDLDRQRRSFAFQIKTIDGSILAKVDDYSTKTSQLFQAGEVDFQSVKAAIMESYRWRDKRLSLAKDLLLVEAETETLILQ